ncbi:MAG: DMT family transporter [Octadecabacter sp.]
MTPDRPFFGIILMLGFCVLAPMGDSLAKLLGESVSLGQLILTRFGVQAAILVPLVFVMGGTLRTTRRIAAMTALRTVLHMIGIGAMFTALRFLPLADTIAIVFVMPFIMLLLGKYVLGEEVGPQRLAACVVGFGGTLLVVQPNFAAVGAPALLPLVVAVVFSLFMLVTRQIAKEVDPITLQANSGVVALVVLLPVLTLFPAIPALTLAIPVGMEWGLLALLGILGTFAHLLMTWSLRFAPSATVAPMQYLEIPIATVIGWLIFRDLPNGLAAVGIVITVAAGLYVIVREQRLSRLPAPPAAE